jgi:hypothetical protein
VSEPHVDADAAGATTARLAHDDDQFAVVLDDVLGLQMKVLEGFEPDA